ncbi:hypothetical protein [Micromonospora sp. 067-2]|uniref:hypothetical protein n=1 Tax=Micromonospora sp. 067-2 TaxID=2789270 RepID=UPI00397A1D6D
MPAVVTLGDLTAMMAADEHHRYEIGPEGVVSIMPPPASRSTRQNTTSADSP